MVNDTDDRVSTNDKFEKGLMKGTIAWYACKTCHFMNAVLYPHRVESYLLPDNILCRSRFNEVGNNLCLNKAVIRSVSSNTNSFSGGVPEIIAHTRYVFKLGLGEVQRSFDCVCAHSNEYHYDGKCLVCINESEKRNKKLNYRQRTYRNQHGDHPLSGFRLVKCNFFMPVELDYIWNEFGI